MLFQCKLKMYTNVRHQPPLILMLLFCRSPARAPTPPLKTRTREVGKTACVCVQSGFICQYNVVHEGNSLTMQIKMIYTDFLKKAATVMLRDQSAAPSQVVHMS